MPPSHAWIVCYTNPCKFLNFILLLNLSLTHLRAQIACYELKGDLSPVTLKEIFHNSFKFSKFAKICMENHSCVTGWQELFSHTNPSNFQQLLQSLLLNIWLKIYRLANFNMLFKLLLTIFFKSKLFLCLPKVDHMTN